MAEHNAAEQHGTGLRLALADKITAMFPAEQSHMPGHCQDDYRTQIVISFGELPGGWVKMHGDGSEVEFERFRVPADIALAMLATAATGHRYMTPAAAAGLARRSGRQGEVPGRQERITTVGTLHGLPAGQGTMLGAATAAYLATLSGAEQANTRRAYTSVLRRLGLEFGTDSEVASIGAEALAEWFTRIWADRAPSTWNVSLDALRSAVGYWAEQGWITEDPARMLRRRKPRPDRDRALSREQVDELLRRESIPLRDRLLWRLLYETAARASEVLGLDVADLDMPNRSARVRRKGGAVDLIVWQTGTARMLPRYLKGRTTGPLFLTERRARVELPPGDLDPGSGRARLSYNQAAALFSEASDGSTLHQLRHSALTHAAEDGTSTPMMLARSGHMSVRSLARYARVSAEALRRHQAATDPARRKR